jgi:hypothetical protein
VGRERAVRWREAGAGALFSQAACPASPLSSSRERNKLERALIDELMLDGEGSLFDLDVEAVVSEHDPMSALIDAGERHHATDRGRLRAALPTTQSFRDSHQRADESLARSCHLSWTSGGTARCDAIDTAPWLLGPASRPELPGARLNRPSVGHGSSA